MKKVRLEDIADDMVLAAPICGTGGNILLGKGSLLKTTLIPRLISWGIYEVFVEDTNAEPAAMPSTSRVSTTPQPSSHDDKSLEQIFSGRLVNEPMKIIYRALCRHRGLDHDIA